MGIWMALVLTAGVVPPEDGELPRSLQLDDGYAPVEGLAAARIGAWGGRGFSFQAVRPDNTQASSKVEALFSASLMGGLQLYDHVVLLGTVEADVATKITGQVEGGYVGWREHPRQHYGEGVPDELMIYGGVLVGELKYHEANFGSFNRGVGFAGGVALGWSLSPAATALFMVEYRHLTFDYQSPVVSGDTSVGGSTIWVGVGLSLRF